MEFYDDYYSPDDLYHWGIKDMKWGVRRFQNKDGSLTDAGRKRYNVSDGQPKKSLGQKISDYKKASKRKANLKKAREARAAKKEAEEKAKVAAEQRKKDLDAGKIKAKDMTNEELKDRINRLNDEKKYKQLMEETDQTSKVMSYGKQFAKKMWEQAIVPAATEAGKDIIKDKIKAASKGKVDVEEFDLDKFWKNRNKKTTKEIQDVQARLNAENAIKKMMEKRESEKSGKKSSDKSKKQNDNTDDASKKQEDKEASKQKKEDTNNNVRSKINSWKEAYQNVKKEEQKDYEKYQNAKNEAAKKAETERSYDEYKKAKTVTGEVIGQGNSNYSNTPQGEQYYVKNPDWREINSSTKTTVTKALNKYGQTSTSSQNYEVQVRNGKDIVDNILNNLTPSTAFNKPKWNE